MIFLRWKKILGNEYLSLYQGSLSERLAYGAVIKHFTTIVGEYVLSNPDSLTDMPEVMHAFILWHAIEELEHKSGVFDAFLEVSKGDLALRRQAFMKAFCVLMSCLLEYQKQFLKQANYQPTWSVRRNAFRYFFGLNGLFSSNMKMVFDYLKADFHPTQH
ncbi:metal-dependent hydrolase [Acinetobacter sp. ANC 3832]|uniref:metal-dependent hydrolase n=1 Tax=Acinetobacter sp. ANC 3832 TaxID=1977874 RepID=UPI00148A4C7D|nr:metal-dependent hydrolase [Acinetobacter sp. ANC 3832]